MPEWLAPVVSSFGAAAAVALTWTKWQVERRTRRNTADQAATSDLLDALQQQVAEAEARRHTDLDHFQQLVQMERREVARLQRRVASLENYRRTLIRQLLDAGQAPATEGTNYGSE